MELVADLAARFVEPTGGHLLDVSIFLVGFRCVHQTILVLSKWAVDFGQGERIDKEVASTEKPADFRAFARLECERKHISTDFLELARWRSGGSPIRENGRLPQRAVEEGADRGSTELHFGEVLIDDQDERM